MGPKARHFRIPEEVAELYSWRNGQAEDVPFFDCLRFQPFEDAVAYGNLVGDYLDGSFSLMVFQELGYDAGYQVRCGPKKQKSVPVYRWEHGDEQIETLSLTDLVIAIAEGFEGGAFRPKSEGGFDVDEDLWNSILVGHHPQRLKAMNALLNRRWAELNADEFRDSFYDLVRISHPETPALIRDYFGSSPDTTTLPFDAFYSILSVGISINDEWTRDFALGLIFSNDIHKRRVALNSLAWSWRGELPITGKHVDALIDQIMTDPASDSENRERAMLLGDSGDPRSTKALLYLLKDDLPVARDVRIAALRALGRLHAVEARQVCLTIARSDPDPGTRISAVRALVDLGFEDAPVEAAAKTYFKEALPRIGGTSLRKDWSPTLMRWMEDTKK